MFRSPENSRSTEAYRLRPHTEAINPIEITIRVWIQWWPDAFTFAVRAHALAYRLEQAGYRVGIDFVLSKDEGSRVLEWEDVLLIFPSDEAKSDFISSGVRPAQMWSEDQQRVSHIWSLYAGNGATFGLREHLQRVRTLAQRVPKSRLRSAKAVQMEAKRFSAKLSELVEEALARPRRM